MPSPLDSDYELILENKEVSYVAGWAIKAKTPSGGGSRGYSGIVVEQRRGQIEWIEARHHLCPHLHGTAAEAARCALAMLADVAVLGWEGNHFEDEESQKQQHEVILLWSPGPGRPLLRPLRSRF